jgi:hypothetical protein
MMGVRWQGVVATSHPQYEDSLASTQIARTNGQKGSAR